MTIVNSSANSSCPFCARVSLTFLFFMCMGVLFHVHLCIINVSTTHGGQISPGTGFTDGFSHHMDAEKKPRILGIAASAFNHEVISLAPL